MKYIVIILLCVFTAAAQTAPTAVGTGSVLFTGDGGGITNLNSTKLAALGNPGQIITAWIATNNTTAATWRSGPVYEEFLAGTAAASWLNSSSTANGGTVQISAAPGAGHPGFYTATTSTSTNGIARARSTSTPFILSSAVLGMVFVVKTPAALSDNTDNYELSFGLSDATTTIDGNNSVVFYYNHNTASGNWAAKTSSGGTLTTNTVIANVAVTAAAYWYLHFQATTTIVNFWVSSDGATWTFIGYSTANIPTAVMNVQQCISKDAGTTSRIAGTSRIELWPP